ncbi:MAG: DUF308 domain-containing protein [Hyphomicrobium sp.]|uniref:HdeD family acid-resistance protein n=1 Tax=Hyphomicrobium sp. CS1BSMeth3 TaxID=1892844 RepID=UPI000931554D|nr:DUF308 domain-containing protein [Hyphomicrobium sp. CS1BSMeth3]MBN9260058.1 DUF308 domain-containing protein [Hyphomicrobium sp.]MBN9267944.1 DUF308 domain-containing protein [Hyphomicrobium sp.]
MTIAIRPPLTSENRHMLRISAWLAIVLGVLAILSPFYAGIAATLLLGCYFLVSGVLEGIVAFRAPSWMGTIGLIALAIISFVAGIFILVHPLAGLVTITLVCIAAIFISGITKLFWSFKVPSGNWLLALSGLLSIIIAGMLFYNFPFTAAWAFGVLVGANLIAEGVMMLGFVHQTGEEGPH